MKLKLFITSITAVLFFGCANGTWHTGSTSTDAALTAATSALTTEALGAANQVAGGSDIKSALVNASGDAIRSLEATAITTAQPVISEQIARWVPHNTAWATYAHTVGRLVGTYVKAHGNTPAVLNAALEAVASTLNNY